MDILIKPKKNRYIIYAIIIAIFSTVGMNISLMNTNADKLLKKFEYSSTWNNFMAVFRTSISGKNDVRLFYQLVAVGITLMFLIIFSYRFCVREIVSSAVVSIIFGFCMWFGTVFSNKDFRYLVYFGVYITDVWRIAHHWKNCGCIWKQSRTKSRSKNESQDKRQNGSQYKESIFYVCCSFTCLLAAVLYRILARIPAHRSSDTDVTVFSCADQISGT